MTHAIIHSLRSLAAAGFASLIALSPTLAQEAGETNPAPNAHLPAYIAPPGPVPGFETPNNWTMVLDNGLEVTFIPWGMTPTIDIRVEVRAGNIDEGRNTWLSDLTVEVMSQGAGGRTDDEIAETFGAMGGSLMSSVRTDRATFMSFVLSEYGPEALALLAETVREPDFPEERFEAARSTIIQLAEGWRQQPGLIATAALNLYQHPEDHPFYTTIPSRAQLDSYTLADVRRFHREHFGAGRTHIYITGQFDAEAMEAAVREHFSDWERGPADEGIDAIPQVNNVVHLIDRPGAPQSTVFLSYPVPPITSKSAPALEVMDTAMGGMIVGRMIETGNSYAPQTFLNWTRGGASWSYTDDIDTEATVSALQDVLTIIDYSTFRPLQAEGIADWMIARYIMSIGSRLSLVSQIALRNEFDLPEDYLDTYASQIRRVDGHAVMNLSREFLARDRMTLVIVGDMDRIEEGIRALPQLQNVRFVREGENE
ncbi:M16 family metallopeptidase [Maricaulis parjimensis]|uniref:M16 family metallopeptidase n=1 Tax=Maricaulis parjimensis TaxID=144023 RepID=UPI00193A64DC|nr:pitrilysin family protein [Maricaulis parjimensis]